MTIEVLYQHKISVGIDCGQEGAMCILYSAGDKSPGIVRLDKPEAKAVIRGLMAARNPVTAYIEYVDPERRFKRSGFVAMRKLSQNYGYWTGTLEMAGIAYEAVDAKTWETVAGLRHGDYDYARRKADAWEKAKQLFPQANIPKYAADAVLIAWYGTMRT